MQGQGASHHFVRIPQDFVVGRNVRIIVATGLTTQAFLLSGVVGGKDN